MKIVVVAFKVSEENAVYYKKLNFEPIIGPFNDAKLGKVVRSAFEKGADFVSVRFVRTTEPGRVMLDEGQQGPGVKEGNLPPKHRPPTLEEALEGGVSKLTSEASYEDAKIPMPEDLTQEQRKMLADNQIPSPKISQEQFVKAVMTPIEMLRQIEETETRGQMREAGYKFETPCTCQPQYLPRWRDGPMGTFPGRHEACDAWSVKNNAKHRSLGPDDCPGCKPEKHGIFGQKELDDARKKVAEDPSLHEDVSA